MKTQPLARQKLSVAVTQLVFALGAAHTCAQPLVLEETIVTAQKRAQNLQDVPIAVATMSGKKVSDEGLTSLEEVTQYMPNVNVNAGAATPNIYVRGIGSGTNSGFEQSVGLFTDGIYAGRGPLAAVPTTMDLERIEILKGPQGILFGKNTIGGAINITSAAPTDEFESSVEALYAPDHNEQQYNAVFSGPLTDTVSARLAVRHDSMEGWWDNITNGETGPDNDNWYGRARLRWDASDEVQVDLKYEHGDFSQNASPTVVYQSDFEGQQNYFGSVPFPVVSERSHGAGDVSDQVANETNVFAVTVNWEHDFGQLTAITGYSDYSLSATQNVDVAATPSFHRSNWEDYEQLSQELRLVSPQGQRIDWLVGGYYQTSTLEISRRIDAIDLLHSGPVLAPPLVADSEDAAPSVFDQESDSWSLFAQLTWNASETLRFTGGIRYNEETKDLDKATYAEGLRVRIPTSPDLEIYANPEDNKLIQDLRSHNFPDLAYNEDKLTYSGIAQWDSTDDIMLYASASTGFKGGGFDEAYSSEGYVVRLADPFTGELTGESVPGVDSSVLTYEPETVTAYEIGAKMTLLNGAADINIAAFRSNYTDLQTSSLVGDVFRVGNAGKAVTQGLELDGRWRATTALTLTGAIAYLDAYYKNFEGATCTVPQVDNPAANPGCLDPQGNNIASPGESGGQDLTDETLLYAPDWSASLSANHVLPVSTRLLLISSLDLNYTSSFYSALDLDPATRHDAATKVNARLALTSVLGNWSVALVGRNLTDETTYRWKNDVPLSNSNSYFGLPDRPRSVAVQVRYEF